MDPLRSDSNSGPVLTQYVASCNNHLLSGRRGGLESLGEFRLAGADLLRIKKLVSHGKFVSVAEEQCGCSRQWAARLMKLASEWHNVQAAMHWQQESGKEAGRFAFSVDSALKLVARWRSREGATSVQNRRPGARKTRDNAALAAARAELQESKAKVAGLNAELIAMKKELAKANIALAAAYGFASWVEDRLDELGERWSTHRRQPIDMKTRETIRKVSALWDRGGTQGEAEAAAKRLCVIANRLGWEVDAMLSECGVTCKADFTFRSAA